MRMVRSFKIQFQLFSKDSNFKLDNDFDFNSDHELNVSEDMIISIFNLIDSNFNFDYEPNTSKI